MIGGTGAEVEVDTDTGQVRVTELVNAADCGIPLNPDIASTQLSGAAVMALGGTMFEVLRRERGQLLNTSLADYKIPALHDIPTMHNELVNNQQRNGPFGAKGIGESGSFSVAPAIANAVHDAVGVRLTQLPLTAEAVLRALRAAHGHSF
jgi:CO/xanthine dehydrogenase Mo-binding subunit